MDKKLVDDLAVTSDKFENTSNSEINGSEGLNYWLIAVATMA